MGITPKDIQAQRELLERGERIREAQNQQAERARLRDTFAAAALTGLLAQGDDGSFSEESYARGAYRWADAMLRERGVTKPIMPKEKPAEVSFAIADAEREAVEWAVSAARNVEHPAEDTLRGLLERMK